MPNHRQDDERVSLHGLTPEEALRALLAVDPESPPEDAPPKAEVAEDDQADD